MAGGPDDERLAMFRREGGDGCGGIFEAEINHQVRLADDRAQIISQIDLAHDFEIARLPGGSDDRLPHSAAGTGNSQPRHGARFESNPQFLSVCFRSARLARCSGTRGRRYSSDIFPSIASAALTGPGLVSMN